MKTIVKMFLEIVSVILIASISILPVSAHNLGRWANYYPAVNADGNDNFGIMDAYHVDGRVAYYKWQNSTVKSYFNTALTQGKSAWGNMINIVENNSNAYFEIQYDPNMASDTAAYVYTGGASNEHYPKEWTAKMVLGNITSYSSLQKHGISTSKQIINKTRQRRDFMV